MVRLIALFGASLLAACVSAQDDALDDGTEPSLKPAGLAAVQRLEITQNAARAKGPESDQADCSGFVVDEAAVRRFFDKTQAVEADDYWHTLDWSPCYASGKVEFVDGSKAVWSLHQLQAGSVVFEDGRETYLYCPECRWKPFVW
ncbi:hypothetical protein [Pseudomonas sp. RIT-PI-AD]|uniref:hypothetical protein n=1 Tax=Pseudomonas sp. RIT-PI-AD TaxID=3035294 RepID=UPI0021D9A131|nr:hypothetical protein [Pseudomonas sp. RIT-PI-AD]